jgi:hydrogenase/urease accessory protein HupE
VLRLLAFLYFLLLARPALAHHTEVSTGSYIVTGSRAHGTLSLPAAPALLPYGFPVRVRDTAGDCAVSTRHVVEGPESVRIEWTAQCSRMIVSIDLPWLTFISGMKHIASVTAGGSTDISVLERPNTAVFASHARPEALALVKIGLLHIVLGWDHVLFLLGLLLMRSQTTKRRLLLTLTAFTLGHSVSLLLARTGPSWVSVRFVETGIALSIALAGAFAAVTRDEPGEARLRPFDAARGLLVMLLGALHGLGFARGLAEVLQEKTLGAVLAFNIGIELGQLAASLTFLACLWMADSAPQFRKDGRAFLGWLLLLIGLSAAANRILTA